jgi:lipopolysaccharide transport system ATP-binding protein
MSILGLSRSEIDETFDEVVAFAEIGDALDSPVQTYSSGMAARLGFACAVHTDPDVLLIDEVLAVGDLKFRMKCFRHLAKLRESGTSFILVSHNSHAILTVCETALYLSRGKVLAAGDAASVMSQYEQDLLAISQANPTGPLTLPQKAPGESTGLDITDVCFKDEHGAVTLAPLSGKPVVLCVRCKARRDISDINLIVAVSNSSVENERVLYLSSHYDNQSMSVRSGNVELQLQLPHCGLSAGLYSAKIVVTQKAVSNLDVVESFRFRVNSNGITEQNLFFQPRKWKASSE